MSRKSELELARRWLITAEEDLQAARVLREAGKHSHACFLAQQCAEKSVKALWHARGEDPWGHSVQKLLMEFPGCDELPDLPGFIAIAARLDRYYIPTRYPNGLPDLTPGQVYLGSDSESALLDSEALLRMSRNALPPDSASPPA
jgi:HEPN domain-containing protein